MKPNRNPFFAAALSLATLALTVSNGRAIDYWWDSDGTTAGFGTTTGTWGTSTFWSTSSAGTAATANTTITAADTINIGTTLNYGNASIAVAAAGVNVNKIVFGTGQSTAVTLGTANTITFGGTAPSVTVSNAAGATIGSVIAGSAGLIKDGTSTLNLTNNGNTFTGGLTIRNGTINYGGTPSAVGASAITMGGTGSTGATLTGSTNGGSFARAITVALPTSGSITLAPNTLGNSATHTGAITLSGGATLTVRSFFANTNVGAGTTTVSGGITGTGNLILENTGTGAGITGATSQVVVSGTTVNHTGTIVARGDNTGAGALTTVSAVIGANVTTFTKQGIVTVVLSGNNAYTGATSLSAGILRATTSANALGAGALTLSGGTLQLANDTALNFARNTTVSGTTTITSDRLAAGAGLTHTLGTLSIGAFTLNVNRGANATSGTGGITFGNATLTGAATLAPAANSLLTHSGTTGLSTFTMTKSGAGQLTLTGVVSGTRTLGQTALQINGGTVAVTSNSNTFTGNIAVDGSGSIFQVATGGTYTTTAPWGIVAASGSGANTKQMLLTNGGAFRLASGSLNVNSTTAANVGAGIIFNFGTGGGVLDVNSGATLIIDDSSTLGTGLGAAQIQGAGSITKIGLGTLQIDDSTAYAGNIIVNAGLLQPASGNAFGTAAGNTTINTDAALNMTGVTMTNAEPITINGTGLASAPAGALTASGTSTWVGPITLGSNSTIGGGAGQLTVTSTIDIGANTLTLSHSGVNQLTNGVISGTGNVIVTGAGGGVVGMSAASTYTGGTSLNSGNVAVGFSSAGSAGNPTSGPFGAGVTPLVLNGAQVRSGIAGPFTVGNVVTIAADTTFFTVSGERSLIFSGPTTISGSNRTLTGNAGTTVPGTSTIFSGAIDDGGNNLGLIKAGTGNLTLGGANTYTGGTTINVGTLVLSGSLPTGTALNVSPTTAGGASFSLASGAANPLTSVSALTLGSATGPSSVGLDLGVDTSTSDSITTPNAATTTGTVNIGISALAGFGSSSTYDLISAPSGLNGATYVLANAPGGFIYSLSQTASLVQLGVSPATAGDLYWRGNTNNSWSAVSGSGTNWFSDLAGSTNAQVNPSAGDSVYFSSINAANSGGVITTTLDNNYTVKRIIFGSNPNGVTSVTIGGGVTPSSAVGILTLAPTSSTDGLSVGSNAGTVLISAPVQVATAQTWSADGIGLNGSALTVSGPMSGSGSLNISGLVTLSAAASTSTYSGTITISSGGILQGGAGNSFSAIAAVAVDASGILQLNGFNNAIGALSGNGTVQNNHPSTGATLAAGDASNTTFTGLIQNGSGGVLGLNKTGTGSLTLTAANTYTGTTTVSAGTLINGSASTFPGNGALALAGTAVFEMGGFNTSFTDVSSSVVGTSITNNGANDATLAITAQANTASSLITDGTKKIAVALTNANSGNPAFLGSNANTFSNGLTLLNSGSGTRLTISSAITTVGTPGAITSSPFGTGPITIGQSATDKAGIYFFSAANNVLANAIVFNTALGTDLAGIRADTTGHTLSGTINANLAPATFSTNGTGSIALTGQVTGLSGLTLNNSFGTNITVTLNNATANPNNYQGPTIIAGTRGFLALGAADQIPNGASAGDVTNNGTLNLNGFSETINGLTGTGTVDGNSGTPTLTLGDNNASGSFSGIIRNTAGALAITKIGTGSQTLSGASTFAGPLDVNGGLVAFPSSPATAGPLGNTTTVSLNGGGLSYTGAGTTALNRTVTIGSSAGTLDAANSTGVLTITSVTSSAGNLIKTGPGSVVISGTTTLNSGAAAIAVNEGTLQAGFGTGGVATISVGSNGNLDQRNAAIEALTLTNVAGALTLSGGAQLGFELNGSTNDSIDLGATGTATTAGVVTLNLYNTGSPIVPGTFNLISSTTGGLAGASYALGAAPNGFNYTINATDNLVSVTVTNYTPIFWLGGVDLSWNNLGSSPYNWTTDGGGLTPAASTPVAADTVVFSATGAPTVSNTITTTLDAAFIIDSLQFSNAPTGVTAVTVAAGSGGTLTLSPLSTSGGIRVLPGGGIATVSAPLTTGATQTWDVDPTGSLIISGDTTFNGAVNKTNTGALTLSGSNSGSAAITLSGGTLNLNSSTALGNGNFTVGAGTTLNASAGATALSTVNAQTWNGNFTFTGANNLNLGTGAVTLANSLAITANASTLTVGGVISDGGNNRSLTKAGAGTLLLSGANTYGGLTTISGGVLRITSAAGLGSTSAGTTQSGTSALELDGTGGAFTVGTEPLSINGGGITNLGALRNIAGDNTYGGTVTMVAQSRINSDSGTLTLSNPTSVSASNLTLVVGGAGNLTISGAIAIGSGGVSKADGSGTLTLSGTNTYNGATTVSAGTLTVDATGSITTAGNVLLNVTGATSVANIAGSYTSTGGGGVAINTGGILNTSGTVAISGANTQAILMGTAGNTGTWNVTGGSVSVNYASNGWGIGNGGVGTLNVSAGSVTTAGSNVFNLGHAAGGTGNLNISGTGLVTISAGAGLFTLGTTATSTASVNLDGGTFVLGRNITKNATAVGTFNFNGGLLRAGLTSTTYMTGLTRANVRDGGAKIDTNSFNITIGQALLHSDLGGDVAIDGGLTKSGVGILTLTGANTYTGATLVNGGTLQLNSNAAAGTLTTSGVTVGASGTLGFTSGTTSSLSLTGKSLELQGGTIAFDVGTGVNDTIQVQDFTLTANSAFTFDAVGGLSNGTSYTVLTSTNPITNSGPFTISGQTLGRVVLTPTVNTDTITVAVTLNEGIWTPSIGGNWSDGNPAATGGNWTNYKPTVSGDAALFGSAITAPSTIVVDTPHSMGYLRFDNASAYTIGSNGSSNLSFNNGADSAAIAVTSGSHVIAENVALLSNVAVQPATATSLTMSGVISGASRSVEMNGLGSLELSGANTYTGVTTVASGTLLLSGNRTTTATAGFSIGTITGTTGTLNLTNGNFTVGSAGSNFLVGNGIASTGIMNQSGGTLTTIGNQLLVGVNTATGTYNLSGGTLTTIAGTLGVALGVNTGATGTFNLSGSGVLSMPAGSTLQISRSDNSAASGTTGSFNQTAGTATVGILQMGGSPTTPANNANSSASLSLTGGTFSAATFNVLSGGNTSTSSILIGSSAQVTLPAFPTNAKGTSSTAFITFDSTTGFLAPVAASATYIPAGTFTNAYLTANGAKFNVDAGKDITVAQVLGDAVSPAAVGTLSKSGTGVLSLAGVNTYTGTTTINAGTLSITEGSIASSSNIVNNAALVYNLTTNARTYANVISGSGTLTKSGTNTLTLTGVSTYSGTTTISTGTLQLGDGVSSGTDGSIASSLSIVNNGALIYNRFGSVSYGGIISGTGTVTKTGAGTQTLSGNNTYTGATTVTNGTLILSGDNSATNRTTSISGGTLVVANVNALSTIGLVGISTTTASGTIRLATDTSVNAFPFTSSSNFPGTFISDRATPGVGITHFLGAAALGANTYSFQAGSNVTSGTAIVSLASLNLTSGGAATCTLNPTTASVLIPGAVNIGSNNQPKTLALGGTSVGNVISGIISNGLNTLTLTKSNTSTWTLTGANTYSGTTTISTGTLQLGDGTTGKDGTIANSLSIVNNAALVYNRFGSISYGGVISGSGTVTKTGAGTQTLSGANTYTGGTTVNNGTLALGNATALGTAAATVNGGSLNLGDQVTTNVVSVGTGGTLTGGGSTGAATLAGTVTPGGTGNGRITMASASVAATSTIALQLPATGTGGTNFDALTVSGALALDGTITVDITGLVPANGQTFDIIDSTGPIDVTNFNVATDLILPALPGGLLWNTSAFASTGVISIVNGDPYIGWAASKGLTGANDAKGADPDGDGKNNLYEFAFDGDPLSGANDGKIVGKIGTVGGNQVLTLTLPVRDTAVFSPAAGDQLSALIDLITYRIEGDESLVPFADTITEVGAGAELTAIQAGLPSLSTGWTYRTFRAPGTVPTVPKAFLRAKISE